MSKNINKATIKIITVLVIIGIAIICCFVLTNRSPLQSAMNVSYIQAQKIEKLLKKNEIILKDVQLSNRTGLSDDIIAYDLTDKTNHVYLLLLDNNNKSLVAVLNSENELVFGMIDSQMGLGDISKIPKLISP